MSKKNRSPHAAVKDWHLWSNVTRTVKPLHEKKLVAEEDRLEPELQKDLVTSVARKLRAEPKPKLPTAPSYSPPVSTKWQMQPGKVIEPGMRKRVVRGHISIDGTIDLHGMRQHEAHAALIRFISARFARGDRTLLVITGKGLKTSGWGEISELGVLRHMLPRWLSESKLASMIAGWETAAQHHGGTGAYYVRLRRADR